MRRRRRVCVGRGGAAAGAGARSRRRDGGGARGNVCFFGTARSRGPGVPRACCVLVVHATPSSGRNVASMALEGNSSRPIGDGMCVFITQHAITAAHGGGRRRGIMGDARTARIARVVGSRGLVVGGHGRVPSRRALDLVGHGGVERGLVAPRLVEEVRDHGLRGVVRNQRTVREDGAGLWRPV